MCSDCSSNEVDPPNWVSVRLREAGNIVAGRSLQDSSKRRHIDGLMFALADRAEFMERHDIDPLRESNWGVVFSNAVVLAAGIVEEFKSGTA